MNGKKIRLRLVPKTKTDISISRTFGNKPVRSAKDFKPAKSKAKEALRRTLNTGVDAKLTKNNCITVELNADQLKDIFQATATPVKGKRLGRSFTFQESHVSSKTQIKLPKEIEEVVEFAYLPSSPEFFAPSFVAPNISRFHLDLDDVLRRLNGSRCHRQGWTGRNIRVAMTDTGFAKHPYFESHSYDIQRISTDQTSQPEIDDSGHGTGESANVLALAPDCQFIGVKHDDYSALALETALEANPHVITNSWGWNIDQMTKQELQIQNPNLYFELTDLENIILDAIDDGVVIVFAAGNGHFAFPGSIPDVISVGGASVDIRGKLEASNYASSFISSLYPNRKVPDFCGIVGRSGTPPLKGHIMLPVPNGCELEGENMPRNKSKLGWGIFSGTSAASPQIAGCIALLLSVNPNLTPMQIKTILSDTTIDVVNGTTAHGVDAESGRDLATGAGFVDVFAACIMAQNRCRSNTIER
ncbi:MAG: S8 family serine peptidase [Saprospiraceae bacterium]